MGLAAKALTRSRLVSEIGLPDDAAGSGQWTLRRFWLGDRVRRSLYFRAQDRSWALRPSPRLASQDASHAEPLRRPAADHSRRYRTSSRWSQRRRQAGRAAGTVGRRLHRVAHGVGVRKRATAIAPSRALPSASPKCRSPTPRPLRRGVRECHADNARHHARRRVRNVPFLAHPGVRDAVRKRASAIAHVDPPGSIRYVPVCPARLVVEQCPDNAVR